MSTTEIYAKIFEIVLFFISVYLCSSAANIFI